jgi:hypothetical protein
VIVNATLLAALVGVAWVGPRVLDAIAAREWAWYHARAGVRGFRALEEARLTGREAARALDRAAPLPLARDGVDAVLALGHELQQSEPRAALAACEPVLQVVSRLEATSWRALGLRERAAELRAIERGARARLQDKTSAP